MEIKKSYNYVGELRKQKEQLDVLYKKAKEEFEEKYEQLIAKRNHIIEMISISEEDLREEALNLYKETGETKLFGGVKIVIRKSIDYDLKEASNWARINAPMCFKFNESAFKTIAKTEPEGCPIKIIKTPSVNLPSKMEAENE